MKRLSKMVEHVSWQSDVLPEIVTADESRVDTLEWADAHPVVYKIVMGHRSKPFGKNSCDYLACGRGDSPNDVLYRCAVLRQAAEGVDDVLHRHDDFHTWRARFTLEHYTNKGFRGGFFQQHDGMYFRGCANLDYTPKTLPEVIDRFVAWCENGPVRHSTREVHVDKKIVRRYPEAARAAR